MATPILNAQIMALRRRLGDTFTEDGTEITASSVGAATTTGSLFKRDELQDIYNLAVRRFIDYMMIQFKETRWHEFLPGYIGIQTSFTLTSGKAALSGLTNFQAFISAIKSGGSTSSDLITFIPMHEYHLTKVGFVSTRIASATNMFCTIMDVSGTPNFFILPDSVTSIDVVFLKKHTDVVHDSATDLAGITDAALQRILLFAEIEARKGRGFTDQSVYENIIAPTAQIDSSSKRK